MYGRRMAYAADVIVVLGCRVHPSGAPTETARRRAARAAQAYAEEIAPWVLVSGGRRWGAHAEAYVIGEELVRCGVPQEALLYELCSLTTFENAIFSSAMLRCMGARRIAVVTCAWHMDRAVGNFRRAGADFEVQALAARVPPSGVWQSLVRKGHEMVCAELDARRMKRARILQASASKLFDEASGAVRGEARERTSWEGGE